MTTKPDWTLPDDVDEDEILPTACKRVAKQAWSIKAFFEFYDRVLGSKIFEHVGRELSEITSDEMTGLPHKIVKEKAEDLSVLEVAAGTGRTTAHLIHILVERSPSPCKLTATDVSAAAIETAKQVLSHQMIDSPKVELMSDVDMADMPFENQSFDSIICGFGLMFPKDQAKVASEFRRVLVSGGRVVITMFHRNPWFELAQSECELHFGHKSRLLAAALRLTDPDFMVSVFRNEGFGTELVEFSHGFTVSRSDTKELLINSCVLLEEFNQCSLYDQNVWLERMTDKIHDGFLTDKEITVKVWLLKCIQGVRPTTVEQQGNELLDLKEFNEFVQADAATKEVLGEKHRAQFLLEHGAAFDHEAVNKFRAKEFARLDANNEIYLDFVGGSLAPSTLLKRQFDVLENRVVGNPHSAGEGAKNSLETVKRWVRRFFQLPDDDDEYEMVFTANCSGAITIVAECFPFNEQSSFVLTKDNHTSMHSIRQYAKEKGACTKYVTVTEDLLFWDTSMNRALENADPNELHLLAYPAQSNATGAKHDLSWVSKAQDKGFLVLLDVAAYISTSRLDLSVSSSCRPDFMPMSFYKMFGHPTGIGCLLAKKSALAKLVPTGLKSGSVCYFSGPWSPTDRVLRYNDDKKFEHGTSNYLAYDAVSLGLEFLLNDIGMNTVQDRAYALTRWLESQLGTLYHDSGSPLVVMYPPGPEMKGATIMLNLQDGSKSIFPFVAVNQVAAQYGIRIRSGCFCNSAIVQHATYAETGSEHCELKKTGAQINTCSDFHADILSEGLCGAVRISFGLASNFADAYSFLLFVKVFLNAEQSALTKAMNQ